MWHELHDLALCASLFLLSFTLFHPMCTHIHTLACCDLLLAQDMPPLEHVLMEFSQQQLGDLFDKIEQIQEQLDAIA